MILVFWKKNEYLFAMIPLEVCNEQFNHNTPERNIALDQN